MGHYKSNVRDLEFNLFEVFNRQEVLGQGIYADVDVDAAKDILHEVSRLAEHELADSLLDSDRNPPVYDPVSQTVTMPDSFKTSFKAYVDGEWGNLDVPAELGGMVVPASLRWSVAEMVCGANPAIHMFTASYSFASLLWHLGTDDQKKLAKHIVDRAWHTTMVLTEPDAGSDVGAGRTKAVQQPDGTWHITGVSASSPRPSPTWSTTSSTSCSPGPRAPVPAPRGSACSWCRSSSRIRRPVNPVSATACSSRASNTRWA